MRDPDAASPPLTHASAGRLRDANGYLVAAGLAAFPILYVASFVYLNLDARYQWGIIHSLDQETLQLVTTFYSPLIWLCKVALAIVGAST